MESGLGKSGRGGERLHRLELEGASGWRQAGWGSQALVCWC